jgi:hypothetical protein
MIDAVRARRCSESHAITASFSFEQLVAEETTMHPCGLPGLV